MGHPDGCWAMPGTVRLVRDVRRAPWRECGQTGRQQALAPGWVWLGWRSVGIVRVVWSGLPAPTSGMPEGPLGHDDSGMGWPGAKLKARWGWKRVIRLRVGAGVVVEGSRYFCGAEYTIFGVGMTCRGIWGLSLFYRDFLLLSFDLPAPLGHRFAGQKYLIVKSKYLL